MSVTRSQIIKGSDRSLKLTIREENGDPYDLTGVTGISASFKRENEALLTVTMAAGSISVFGNPILGKIVVNLTDAETILLAAGVLVDFKVILDVGAHPGGTRSIIKFDNQIDVIEAD